MPTPSSRRPDEAVLAAFGLEGRPVALPGGQGRAWLVDGALLKPLDVPVAALAWQARLGERLAARTDLRVSVPLPTTAGAWAGSGWTAWRYEPGSHLPGRWHDVVAVGERLHAALRDEPEPAFLADRTDLWAVADRVAWGELPAEQGAGTPHLDTLLAAVRPVGGTPQLVHGDLTGNVLFHPGLPPLVIDLSPYWRPPAYASAVVVADALGPGGAGPDVVAPLLGDPDLPQHLLRALAFRAVAGQLAGVPGNAYGPAVALAVSLAG